MMGFLPGLPYLGGLPPEFGLPRRENPRIKVPKGAVAVAMSMTVIYPLESPGGWHMLARTPVPLWDMGADPPALLDAGDKVMFEPIPLARYEAMLAEAAAGRLRLLPENRREPEREQARMTAALRVIAPGLMTTLQDLGRRGYQHLGVPVSGALDPVCLQAANLLAGNAPGMGALEIAYQGPTLAIEADSVRIALAGGQAAIDILGPDGGAGQRLAPFESARLTRGQTLRIGALSGSAILYLAVEGGFAIRAGHGQPVDAHARWHRRLRGPRAASRRHAPAAAGGGARARGGDAAPARPAPPARVRVVLGPQDDHFTQAGLATLLAEPLHDLARLRPHGHAARGAAAPAFGQGLQHRLRRHRPGLHPGAGQRPAHRAAGRPADDRRLSRRSQPSSPPTSPPLAA